MAVQSSARTPNAHHPTDDPHSLRGRAALIVACVFAATCAVGSLRSSASWAAFFAHPLVEPAITLNGANLLRLMLVATAITTVLGTMLMVRLARGRSCSVHQVVPSGRRSFHLYGIAALIVLGFAIRAMRINESLWYDEIASWRTYNGGTQSFGAVIGAFLDPINHTFHSLLNRFSVQWLVGEIGLEAAFRFPALVFSLATIPIMFGLGRAAGGSRIGWFCAVLTTTTPVCVLEGVEARGYSMMIFFSAAATWTLIAAMRRSDPLLWLLYALCCALGVWAQFVTAWVAIGHGAWLAWRWMRAHDERAPCLQGMLALVIAGTASITLHAPMIPGLLAWRSNFVAERPDQPRILGAEGLHALMQLGGGWTWKAAAVGLGLAAAGAIAIMRRRNTNRTAHSQRDVVCLALLGAGLMLMTVALAGTWLYARFMLFIMPGAILLMAAGIDEAWRRFRLAGVAALVGVVGTSLTELALTPPKQPLRDAMEHIQADVRPDDRVVVIGLAHDVLSIYRSADDLAIIDSFTFGSDLQAKLDAASPRWVIVEYPLHVPADRYALLEARGYRLVKQLDGWADWGHGDVLVYEQSHRREPARGGSLPQS